MASPNVKNCGETCPFYPRIGELRWEHHLSCAEVARRTGVSPHTYRNYELGRVPIRAKFVIRLAYFYNVSIDYIVELIDQREPHQRKKQDAVSSILLFYCNQ